MCPFKVKVRLDNLSLSPSMGFIIYNRIEKDEDSATTPIEREKQTEK